MVKDLRRDRLRAALFDEPVPERRIGRYRVVGLLGRGGMGTVLEAIDDTLKRRVALKVLHLDVPRHSQGRLLREAQALARLSHPNVVQVHEVQEDPRPFIAMELVRGRTLAQWQRTRHPWRECVRTYLQAGHGLAAAHRSRLVHRDFKPANCIMDEEGRVRVMDFGLVRPLEPFSSDDRSIEGAFEPLDSPSDLETPHTSTGAVLGTVAYMAPEQLGGAVADAASDQFSFCVSLYEALYGRRPWDGRSVEALRTAMHGGLPSPRSGAKVPAAVRRVLLRGLAIEPAQRWPSMDALLVRLERCVRPRWRGHLALGALVGGVGLLGFSMWREASLRRACQVGAEQLAGVWTDPRRDQVRAALLGSSLPYAGDAWATVEPRLDAYADAWVDGWRDVCEASRIRQDQPEAVVARRSACLHERRVALQQAVDVLQTGEPEVVEHAVELVMKLPQIERCYDVPTLLADVPPPTDPEDQARVQDLRDALTRARTLRIAGHYAPSLEVVEQTIESAQGLGYPPLHAEIEQARGWALQGLGRNDEAIAAYEDAYTRAVESRHDAVAADTAAVLGYLVGGLRGKHELGFKWSVTAQAHARRPEVGVETEALVLGNLGTIHFMRGEFEQAEQSFEQAIHLLEQAFGPDDFRLPYVINGLGMTYTEQEEFDRALAMHQRALKLRRSQLGPHHPHVAISLSNLGALRLKQGKLSEAEMYFLEAIDIDEQRLGSDHPDLIAPLGNLGSIRRQRGDYTGGRAVLERAIDIALRTEKNGPRLGRVLHAMGHLLLFQGELEAAADTLKRALVHDEQVYSPTHPSVIQTVLLLGQVELERGELEAAEAYAQRALATDHAVLRHSAMALQVRLGLARGEGSAMVALAERVLEARMGANYSLDLAEAQLLLARALGPDDPRAQQLAQRARELLEPHQDTNSARIRAEVDAWLAQATPPSRPR